MMTKYVKCARCGKLVDTYVQFGAIAHDATESVGFTTEVAIFNIAQSHRTTFGKEKVYCMECGTDISEEIIGIKQEENNV